MNRSRYYKFLLRACLSILPLESCWGSSPAEEDEIISPCIIPSAVLSAESSEILSSEVFKSNHYLLDPENKAEAVLKRLLKDRDGRQRVTDTRVFPYSAQVHFKTTFPSGKGEIGSGTFIGNHIILTAGHVVYSHAKGGLYKTLDCFIDANQPKRAGNVIGVKISRTYITQKNAWDTDYALVFIDQPTGNEKGCGSLGLRKPRNIDQLDLTIAGYPKDKIDELGTLSLWEMTGRVISFSAKSLRYDIDTYAGQSGSGIWYRHAEDKQYYVVGIHAYGPDDVLDNNRGPRLINETAEDIVGWMKAFQEKSLVFDARHTLPLSHGKISGPIESASPEEDDESLPALLLEKAKAGDGEAQYEMGLNYIRGEGVNKDPVKALEWFGKAFAWCQESANQGVRESQHKMGAMYENGRIVGKDKVKAIEWYHKAADQGYANSQNNLGTIYENKNNLPLAVAFYERAALQGHARSQYRLGELYKRGGKGVAKDKVKAIEWWQKAAAQGYEDAIERMKKLKEEVSGREY